MLQPEYFYRGLYELSAGTGHYGALLGVHQTFRDYWNFETSLFIFFCDEVFPVIGVIVFNEGSRKLREKDR